MKYLSCPDFHFSMARLETSRALADKIAKAAREHAVDFIALPGDLFNSPIYASDAGGINDLRAIIRSWIDICPVLAVEGTPSHDAPGAYGPLEDAGLTLLRPNDRVFGGDGIVFGIPELRKDTLQAALGLPAEQANAEAVRLLREYLSESVAPMRRLHPGIPAIGLLHGVVTDYHRDDVTDPAIKASDIIIRTEDLALAGLDYWNLGHIHTPWASSVIPASYAGSWGTAWGETGFLPAFQCITIETGREPIVERIPYGTPRREKISRPEQANSPWLAYWLESDDPDAVLPDEVHGWSRVTYKEQRTETRRVTAEQAEAATSLADLFRLADPDFDEALVPKVEAAEQTTASVERQPIDVRILSVEIQGCTFFGGETRSLDIAALPASLTAIIGENGSGKSALLSFCSPYPVVIGKDTRSGRQSAISGFFSGRDSLIRKRLTVNGVPHEHLITIKGAHTQSPKTECYLFIDGAPLSELEVPTFDAMMAKCEELYGAYADYSVTTFYEQPQQASSNQSGLMSARMVDARDLVQNIAGIDRSAERRYALDRVSECEREIASLGAKIEALSDGTDTTDLEQGLEWSRASLEAARTALVQIKQDGEGQKVLVATLATKKQEAEAAQVKKGELEKERRETESKIGVLTEDLVKLRESVESLESNRETVTQYEGRDERIRVLEKEKAAVATHDAEAQRIYSEALSVYNETRDNLRRHDGNIERLEREIESSKETARSERQGHMDHLGREVDRVTTAITANDEKIKLLDVKCPQCGYVDEEAKVRIASIESESEELRERGREMLAAVARKQIIDLPTKLRIDGHHSDVSERESLLRAERTLSGSIPAPVAPVAPVASEYDDSELRSLIASQSMVDISALRASIESGVRAESEIAERERAVTEYEAAVKQASDYLAAIVIDSTAAQRHADAVERLDTLRGNYTDGTATIARLETTIEKDEAEIQRRRAQAEEVEAMRDLVKDHTLNNDHWTYIAMMLAPNKIPALELDIMLDTIDADATRNIAPYHDKRFSIRTETQGTGKKGQVDRFDILVHDAETGAERSFLAHSPGQKAFFNDAYVKALVRQRNARSERSYSPIVMDEADGPISPALVPAFYEMQAQYYDGADAKVLVVSHAPGAHQFVSSHVEVVG
jgi:DNA repair exonuclease SbcCD nuclease subunit/predicted Zn-ribbon and HTH transcriptional regulator